MEVVISGFSQVGVYNIGMKILLVEDDEKISASVKKGLELEGMVVDVAFDGEEGLDMALGGEYGVIVLDVMLPKMDGMEVCEEIRKEGVDTPLLILTARSGVEYRVRGLNLGADDYLPKPFAFAELVARVRALGRRSEKFDKNVLQVGELKLDVERLVVSRSGKEIVLSRREFNLLEFLMRNKGMVMSKEQIISKVWPYDTDVLPNTVEVYVGYLRNKVDKSFEGGLIKTVRGFGYKLEED